MGELPFKRTPRHFAGKRFVILGRFAAIILPTYLSELGFSPFQIGIVAEALLMQQQIDPPDKANRWRLFTPAIAILPQIGNNGAQLGDSTAAAPSWSADNEPRRAIRMVARSRSTAW